MAVYRKAVGGPAGFREAYLQSLARTVYPYVPTVYSVDSFTLSMQKIKGFTLAQTLVREGYGRLRTFLVQLEVMRKKLHSIGLIHNDMHTANIIIESATGNMYLIDFGTAYLIHGMPNVSFTEDLAIGHHGDHIEAEALARFDMIYMRIACFIYVHMTGSWAVNYDTPHDLLLEEWPPIPTQYSSGFRTRILPYFSGDEDMTMADYRRAVDIFLEIVESTTE